MNTFLTYYKLTNKNFMSYDGTKFTEIDRIPYTCPTFEMLKSPGVKEATKKKLREYHTTFYKCATDIREYLQTKNINYDIFSCATGKGKYKEKKYYKKSYTLTLDFFKFMSSKESYSCMEPMNNDEQTLTESTFNAGLQYGKIGDYDMVYSYDCKMFYPRLLTMLKIAREPGSYGAFDELPSDGKFQYGYYQCEIEVTGKISIFFKQKMDENKTPSNWHTHFDMLVAVKLQRYFPDLITIKPLGRKYTYDDDDLIDGNTIFGKWYRLLKDMKKNLPGNIIVKCLSSSLWGSLCQKNVVRISEDEAMKDYNLTTKPDATEGHLIIDVVGKKDGSIYYTLRDLTKPYQKYPFRIKSFLCAFGRYHMVKRYFQHIDHIVRIQTDGVMLLRPLREVDEDIKFEPDKSGSVTIKDNVNCVFWLPDDATAT